MAKKAEIEQTEIEAPYELPEGWRWKTLGNTCDMYQPKTISTKELIDDGKYLVYGANGVIGRYDKYNHEKAQLLITCRGATCGAVNISEPFSWINGNAMVINPKDENLDLKYLAYIFQSEVNFNKVITGSAQPQITRQSLLPVIIPLLPTLAEQQRIVNRIETMFAKLDQAQKKAQVVLDSFETRKAAILHKAFTGQLRIDNEELKIEDWEDTTIGKCCRLGSGGTPSKSHPEYYENGDIPWLKTGEIDWNDIYDVEERITNEGVENSSAKIFPAESVVVAMYGMGVTRGKAAIIKIPTATNQAVCVLQPNEKLNNRFLFYYFMCNYWQIREQSVGGNQLNLSGKIIASFPIKLPPLNYQLSIVNFLDTVLEKESHAKEAAQTVLDQIALLKKSILARAFRGEL
ncbi:MAG: restriction endonuclease subunit S [Treponema sp.]|nr:restriction endonuclease subunit S [Treponema sp.]